MRLTPFVPVARSSVVISETRLLRSRRRELILASDLFREDNASSIKKLATLSRKTRESHEISSRIACYGAFLAIKKGKMTDAEMLLKKSEYSPSILARSLKIMYLSKQMRLDEAMDELDKCLNESTFIFDAANSQISEEALDALYSSIKSRDDTSKQMRRFRAVQRLLTSYGKRNKCTIMDLLESALNIVTIEDDRVTPSLPISNKVLEQAPHFLSEEKPTNTTVL